MTLTAFSLKKWKSDGIRPDTKLMFSIVQRLDPLILTDGRFVDKETRQIIRRNHLKCMLRREYIEEGGNLRGRALDKVLDGFLYALVKISNTVHEEKQREAETTGKSLRELADWIPEPMQYLPS